MPVAFSSFYHDSLNKPNIPGRTASLNPTEKYKTGAKSERGANLFYGKSLTQLFLGAMPYTSVLQVNFTNEQSSIFFSFFWCMLDYCVCCSYYCPLFKNIAFSYLPYLSHIARILTDYHCLEGILNPLHISCLCSKQHKI